MRGLGEWNEANEQCDQWMRLINFKEILQNGIQLEKPHLLVLFESAPSGATKQSQTLAKLCKISI